MKNLLRPLAFSAAFGIGVLAGTDLLLADGKEGPKPAPSKTEPAKPAEAPLNPVKITDAKVETKFAVQPKPLSPAVKKGLEMLIKNQQEDGGWNQGGGWRTGVNGQGGRIEGKNVEDPSDVGNSCVALLALVRSGSTPVAGDYKEAAAKGLKYILGRIEKADTDSLYVTDVRNTQLQSKIGPYVDTFLANLVLAELKGSGGPEEKRLVAALEKTMNKIVKHQTKEGGFANNGGWAPVLSVSIANKGIARAKQNGVVVDDKVLARALEQTKTTASGTAVASAGGDTKGVGGAGRGLAVAGRPGGAGGGFGGGDAGVTLYSLSQGAGNSQDVVNGLQIDAKKAREVLKDGKAKKEDKDRAEQTIRTLDSAVTANTKAQTNLAANVKNEAFVAGFGSNGGEEFLSFMNISEALLVKGGKEWQDWDAKMVKGLERAQDQNGSWSGHHCITGKTFCTAGALLVLMADRTPFAAEALIKKDEVKKEEVKPAPSGAKK